jgi:hypothetical protein
MAKSNPSDPESGRGPKKITHWRMIIDQGVLTPEIEQWHYHGKGTEETPFAVTWIDNDPRNPMIFPGWYKWMITITMAFSTLAVSLCSSAFGGGMFLFQLKAARQLLTLDRYSWPSGRVRF